MINKIKNLIKINNLDGYIVPKNDEYFTEYSKISNLEKVANFTGSAGFVIILKKKNYLFVDGRYIIQAKKESGKKFTICEFPYLWPKDVIKNVKIGFNPKFFTTLTLTKYFSNSCELIPVNENIFDYRNSIYKLNSNFYKIDSKNIGENENSKIKRVINFLRKKKLNHLFISAGENVCWLLNIRGRDLPNSPIANCQIILSSDKKIYFFSDIRKINKIKNKFNYNKIYFYEKDRIFDVLNSLKKGNFCIDQQTCSIFYESLIHSKFKILYRQDPIYKFKSIKNKIEIKNMLKAHIEDGVAITKFLYWIKNLRNKEISEISLQNKLEKLRKKSKNYLYPSFNTIAGSGPNGAIIHYRSSSKTNRYLRQNDILLVDSGGQYKWGTTDVTRTICIGSSSQEIKNNFTRVLKGHIAVARANISNLKTGHNIDKIARQFLNKEGLNYRHGTGHGVGFFLNVHEGPQSLSKNNHIVLEQGMILSNEPGYYKENNYGIRIENLVFIKKINRQLRFKNLTFAPIDKDLINFELLNKSEKDYLFNYSLETYSKLSPYLNSKEKKWLISLI